MSTADWIFVGLIGFTLYAGVRAITRQSPKQDTPPQQSPSRPPSRPTDHRTSPAKPTPIPHTTAPQRIVTTATPGFDTTLADWGRELRVIWHGECPDIEFTYRTTRRTVTPQYILRHTNGDEYIHGYCHVRNENRTFNLNRLDTKILMKSRRYDPYEWLEKIIGPEYWNTTS